jgi:glycosyltransferase involved in cell wall biosynthesis
MNTHKPLRLLALSWAMPPLLFPRSIQVSRLLKELCAGGWQIDVLCADPDAPGLESSPRDESLAALSAGGHRVLPVRWGGPPEAWEASWIEAGCEAAAALLADGGYDAFATFAQPWSDHEIGLRIKSRFAVPWVAHFSDPWSDSPYYAGLPAAVLRDYAAAEARVVQAADALVFTSQPTLDLVMAKYPADFCGKASVVPHGFDAAFLRNVRPEPRSPGTLRVVHVGTLYADARTPEGLFEALARLLREDERARRLELVFVGHAPAPVRESAARLGVEGHVTWPGVRPYAQCLGFMASADLLLVIDKKDPVSVFFPSKLVEYLPWGKPVLGLTPQQGVTAGILQSLGWPCVEPDDVPGICERLSALLGSLESQGREPVPGTHEGLGRYDIRVVAQAMAGVIRRAVHP